MNKIQNGGWAILLFLLLFCFCICVCGGGGVCQAKSSLQSGITGRHSTGYVMTEYRIFASCPSNFQIFCHLHSSSSLWPRLWSKGRPKTHSRGKCQTMVQRWGCLGMTCCPACCVLMSDPLIHLKGCAKTAPLHTTLPANPRYWLDADSKATPVGLCSTRSQVGKSSRVTSTTNGLIH